MQRHALGLLFAVLAAVLGAVSVAALVGAAGPGRWIVGLAALALAGWLGSLALSALRR